jgi:hypothetical protein
MQIALVLETSPNVMATTQKAEHLVLTMRLDFPSTSARAPVSVSEGKLAAPVWLPGENLSNEIVGSQHYGSIGLGLVEKLARCSLFNYFAQPDELIDALVCPHVTFAFKIVHRRSADRAPNDLALVEHRKANNHPIEVVVDYLTTLQPHRKMLAPGAVS